MTSYAYYVVITQPHCEYCKKATDLLQEKNIDFTNVNLDTSGWIYTLVKQAGLKTVPQIYGYNGEYVGGYEELKEKLGVK